VSEVERFEFRFVPVYRRVAQVFGVTPRTAWVDLYDDALEALFGPWHVRTALLNVTNVEVTGPYAFLKTVGPARLAVSDRGLTFATNSDRGVLVTFRVPVPGIEPLWSAAAPRADRHRRRRGLAREPTSSPDRNEPSRLKRPIPYRRAQTPLVT
jgi:hypothetical protein